MDGPGYRNGNCNDAPMLESAARVVAIDGETVWLQPEPDGGCGTCAAASRCGAATLSVGAGTVARRIASRRIPVLIGRDTPQPEPGERVVVGLPEEALVKAALTAYVVPLVAMLAAAALAESANAGIFATPLAAAAGLSAGLVLARRLAKRLADRGALVPRLLRTADGDLADEPT